MGLAPNCIWRSNTGVAPATGMTSLAAVSPSSLPSTTLKTGRPVSPAPSMVSSLATTDQTVLFSERRDLAFTVGVKVMVRVGRLAWGAAAAPAHDSPYHYHHASSSLITAKSKSKLQEENSTTSGCISSRLVASSHRHEAISFVGLRGLPKKAKDAGKFRSTFGELGSDCCKSSLGSSTTSGSSHHFPVVQATEQVLTEAPTVDRETSDQGALWKGFVERVSGEWDGCGADFNFVGEPSELPSQVVPDAFRDWAVEVYDWQTMCPTLGQEEPETLGYKVIRLLPTVGCEADAATPYCIEERDFGTALTYAFHANGSYNAVWPGKGAVRNNPDPGRTGKIVVRNTENTNEWEVEHCLVKEGGSSKNRTRILQQFRVDDNTKVPQLKNITVYIEQWDGPFRNGESLGGCSTSGSGFATTDILQPTSLIGSWHADSFFAKDGEPSPNLLTFEGSRDVERPQTGEIVALPKNLWSSVKASEGAASYTIEAGWMLNSEQIIVSSLDYLPSGDFQGSRLRFEQKR